MNDDLATFPPLSKEKNCYRKKHFSLGYKQFSNQCSSARTELQNNANAWMVGEKTS
jgi:hypothetical protein